ncbi:putative hydrolase of the HAD superfamily [Microterricola gilva]|uniref:Putative hydrolase of the HAD superfamily n=1 Tax=Microterricola gilva TaxID=393267 RepID=A0A4V2GAQ6_9MICO|nr:HAD family hydrolase [Microterricola gilva]RZU65236.1 putative hydrolase of the HAD superfamily [Microterricola gilva]
MPVFLDLDNTLVDRDAAFSQWADVAVASWGGEASDAEWLIRADAHGYTPRAELAAMILERLKPDTSDLDVLVAQLLYEHVDFIECYPGVLAQLDGLAAIGERLVIVTNGDSQQQRMKLRRTALAEIVTGSVISGELGFKKPDARIFAAAREVAQADGIAWMVGDHAEADIAGGRAAGLATAWVAHGRLWSEPWAPTLMCDGTAEVLALINSSVRSAR